MIVKIEEAIFDVDIDATKNYYKENTLCDCQDCRNFYVQVEKKYPALAKFLSSFRVDVSRPDELGAAKTDNIIDYQFAAYTVAGELLQSDKYEMALVGDKTPLNITVDSSYVPNEQVTEDYFTITVYGIQLPWVLDEEYSE